MNTLLMGFLAMVIIVAIIVSVSYFTASYLIQNSTELNTKSSGQSSIKPDEFDNPGSARYYYEGWFFIANNQKIYAENILFNRGTDFVVTLTGSTLNVYVNGGTADSTTGVFDPCSNKPLISIPNFPFQKWAHLVINIDGMSIDLYIDGKFVKNVISPTVINSTASHPITYGNKFTIGKVARFKRPSESINPQGVWSHYMNGSGQSQSLTNYHLNAIVTKRQHETINQRLF